MATSTLVQFLGDGITSPTGAGADTSNRRQVETFISGAAIIKGDVVMLDTSKTGADRVLYIKQCANVATGNPLAVGVALNAAAAAGEQVRVVVAGYAADVDCAGGTILIGAAPLRRENGSRRGRHCSSKRHRWAVRCRVGSQECHDF